jgi:hypothetical protein
MKWDRAVVILRGLGVALLLALLLPSVAQASTLTVTNTNDSGTGSLRAALASAQNGDTIVFAPSVTGTITLATGTLNVANGVTIVGPGANVLTVDNGAPAPNGGVFVINNLSAPVTLSGLTITGGSIDTTLAGAGVDYGGSQPLTLTGVVVSGNSASNPSSGGVTADGGGIRDDGSGGLTVKDSTISGNSVSSASSGGNGGGIYSDTSLTLINSTIANNNVTGSGTNADGGGILNTSGTLTVVNATIAGNSAQNGAGGLQMNSAVSSSLANTIIARNTGTAPDCSGSTATSQGYNLIGNPTGCNFTTSSGDQVGSTANPINPLLGQLANNGGSTPTMPLLTGSPAIDSGNPAAVSDATPPAPPALIPCSTTDQRGVARPQPSGGRCDIGAYELVPSGASPPPPSPSAPVATPGSPTVTGSTGASFSGSVNPEGQVTTAFFEYGIDGRYRPGGGAAVVYDQSTPSQTLPADSSAHVVSASVSGLVPNAVYHVRLIASNATGTTLGPDQTFTTQQDPAPPPPRLGRTLDAKPVTGRVFVLVGTTLVPLTEARQLRSGSVVDALAGSLQLTAALPRHKRETGVFGGAIFRLTQTQTGLTNLSLVESAFPGAPSYTTCRAARTGDASAAALSSRTLQLLRASAHGKFRTTGRYSAATVRGTKWTVADRCDGTLTHDITDSVTVTDFVRHRTIVLRAGHSYLARPPRRG